MHNKKKYDFFRKDSTFYKPLSFSDKKGAVILRCRRRYQSPKAYIYTTIKLKILRATVLLKKRAVKTSVFTAHNFFARRVALLFLKEK
ncbi:MAG: hypothetical protein E7538_10270 [Ruminococcaceae bacterium]|nr:hypothetical protein [Oscillospiraceae bacterium]